MKKLKFFLEGLATIVKYSIAQNNVSINNSSSNPIYINDDLEAL